MLRTLNEIRALKDPAKQSEVEFVISQVPGALMAKLTQKVAGIISGNTSLVSTKELRLRCTSFDYPGSKVNQTELIIAGHSRKTGTIQDRSGTWKCKVTEDYQGGVLNFIEAWCDLIHAPILGTRLPRAVYVGTASITLGEGINGNSKKRTIWMRGFYPISYSVGSINPNSSNPVEVNITFHYDYFADNSYSLLSTFLR